MGIPKFYRWLSERYPLLNQKFTATEAPPEVDNLYLDMNGIIHNCTHANQKEVKLSEQDMMLRIFDYIDKLVQIIRPKKLLFMAIDGVAPRAKMNQQRSRRFKAAKERLEVQEEKARKGEAVQADAFDSNCITPGTPFMERLGKHLRFFIRRKMSEDPLWQQPTVIFSGHEVPGEGEHKIMEYLRWEKKSPAYQPNQRHCLYGLDADLIMLSLVTHEPHFVLLREIVSYTGGNKGQPAREVLENPCAENFILFHIGLLREYLELEFRGVPVPFEPSGQVDVERVVDDFVLFCMLVGNDFLPALPTLDINEGALNRMMTLYKELLGRAGGYLTYAGDLDRRRLELLLARLGQEEQEVLEERAKDAEFFESKRAKREGRGQEAWVPAFRRDASNPALNGAANGTGSSVPKTGSVPKLLTGSSSTARLPANGSNGSLNGTAQASAAGSSGGTATGSAGGAVRQAAGPGSGPGFGGPANRRAAAIAATPSRFASLDDGVDAPGTPTPEPTNPLAVAADAEVPDAVDDVVIEPEKDSKPPTPPPPELAAFFEVIGAVGADVALEGDEEEVAPVVSAEPTMMSKEARRLILAGEGNEGLLMWKNRWYKEKLEADTPEKQRRVAECYLQGLHWVLEYYYRGVASWDWYYPYHYAPMASDMVNLEQVAVRFTQGKPFRPFEQLLSVLPAASAPLLPPALQPLLLDPQSPIIDFYPDSFDVDMEGKRASWEGVVKVPFIDEARLLAAVQQLGDSGLSADEKSRNTLGQILIFNHQQGVTETDFCASTMPKLFRDIAQPHSRLVRRNMPPPLPLNERGFSPVLVPHTNTGLTAPSGYPTLKSIQVKACLRQAGINVLGTPSRKESLLLQLPGMSGQAITAAQLAPRLLGKRCYVNWPYLQEANIVRVSDAQEQWYLTSHDQPQAKKWQSQEATKWKTEGGAMANALLTKHGLEVGKVELVLHVRVCRGFLRHMDGTIEKQYAQDAVLFPLQVVLRARPGTSPAAVDAADTGPPTVQLKEGDKVVFLGKSHYGCIATILPNLGAGMTRTGAPTTGLVPSYRIRVTPLGPGGQDPAARPARQAAVAHQVRYFPSGDVSRKLRLNPRVLGRITSNVWISDGDSRYDVGLLVRAPSKGLCVPGFACPSPDGQGWTYSAAMMNVLQDYRVAHAWVFEALERLSNAAEGGGGLRLSELMPEMAPADKRTLVAAAAKWVKSSPLGGKPLVKASVTLMADEGVRMLQMTLPHLAPQPAVEYENVPPALLLPPFAPGPEQVKFSIQGGHFDLGDRVVCCLKQGLPPFGLFGTVIGVYEGALEVLFDKEFPGGTDLGGKLNTRSGGYVPKDVMLNLSHPATFPLNKSQVPRPVSAHAPGQPQRQTPEAEAEDVITGLLKAALVDGGKGRQHRPASAAGPSGSAVVPTTATAASAQAAPPPPPMLSAAMMAHAAGGQSGRGGRGGAGRGGGHGGGPRRAGPHAVEYPVIRQEPISPEAGKQLLDKLIQRGVVAPGKQAQPPPPPAHHAGSHMLPQHGGAPQYPAPSHYQPQGHAPLPPPTHHRVQPPFHLLQRPAMVGPMHNMPPMPVPLPPPSYGYQQPHVIHSQPPPPPLPALPPPPALPQQLQPPLPPPPPPPSIAAKAAAGAGGQQPAGAGGAGVAAQQPPPPNTLPQVSASMAAAMGRHKH